MVDYRDTICECNHWFEEHTDNGCFASHCRCIHYVYEPEANTPSYIADRGGEHNGETCRCALCKFERGERTWD